jgi:NAD(P)H-nitrite reductase large subunit
LDETHKKIHLENGSELDYDTLIVATGSKSRMLGWPGQELKGVQGLYSLQDLESMEENTKGVSRAVISGGGLIGVEMAEMLHSRGVDVTILILESGYWRNVLPLEESEIICRHLEEHGIKVILNAEIKEIVGDDDGRVKNVVSKSGEKIDCQFVGLTVGVQPNLDFLENSNVEINRGILVDEYLRTSVQDIYAIGDCSEQRSPLPGRRAIEAVWYTGRMMGEVVAETICGKPVKYKPGVWFNSAKFFDIEYQTYGNVLPDLPENQNSFFWQHDSGSRCLRLVYEKASMKLIGINVLGIRFRHEVCDRWLKEGLTIFQVMENLVEANFDPEFYNKYEDDIVNSFNQLRLGEEVKITRKKKLFAGFFN